MIGDKQTLQSATTNKREFKNNFFPARAQTPDAKFKTQKPPAANHAKYANKRKPET